MASPTDTPKTLQAAVEFFADPANYRGKAAVKARALANKWNQEIAALEAEYQKGRSECP